MHRSLLSIPLLICFLLAACSVNDNSVLSNSTRINQDWAFLIDSTGAASPDELGNELQWEDISIPHTPRIEPLVVNDQWQGICWYKKELEYNPDWKNKELFLRFEGAMNVAEVWVNGTKKIKHFGGYLPFVIRISDDITPDQINTIYVRLNNEDNEVTGPKPLKELDFNMYGGIYRDVFLQVKSPVHITDEQYAKRVAGGGIFVTYPEVSASKAVIEVQTNLYNAEDKTTGVIVRQELKKEGMLIASAEKKVKIQARSSLDVLQSLAISDPALWSPRSPDLYTLETLLEQKNKKLDRQITKIGIRKFEFRGNKLYLNNEEVFLRGVNRHQEYPYIGYALSDPANYRDARKIKEAGFDYVRLSHYPHSKAFMDACDELGIVTLDAILGWQYYREYEPFRKHVLQTCRDLIRRDRNRPSVLAWEVSLNESWMPEEFIDSLTSIAREEYPHDFCYTAGWQRYGYDIFLQARQHRLEHDDNRIPDKPYIVSEYGDWEYYALNAGLNQDAWSDLLPGERSSRQLLGSGEKNLLQQALNVQQAHNSNFETPAVADGYWVMFDYNRGYADDLEASGIMSLFRLPKFAFYFFQSQRDAYEPVNGQENPPMVFLASYNDQNSSGNIRIFSNCEEVELYRNDQSLGRRLPDKNIISNHLRHPPITFTQVIPDADSLTAVGYIGGKEVARHRVWKPGMPSRISIEADLSGKEWKSGCNDGIFIRARIMDENQQILQDYHEAVSFTLTGEAEIIGNTNPIPEAGIATILVKAGTAPGTITLSATSGELISDPFVLETKACLSPVP